MSTQFIIFALPRADIMLRQATCSQPRGFPSMTIYEFPFTLLSRLRLISSQKTNMLLILFSIPLRRGWSVLAQSTTFSGGLALRFPGACPSDLVSGGVTFESNCCAANQTFVKDEADSVCCPDGQHKIFRKSLYSQS